MHPTKDSAAKLGELCAPCVCNSTRVTLPSPACSLMSNAQCPDIHLDRRLVPDYQPVRREMQSGVRDPTMRTLQQSVANQPWAANGGADLAGEEMARRRGEGASGRSSRAPLPCLTCDWQRATIGRRKDLTSFGAEILCTLMRGLQWRLGRNMVT
jgi:hypothetical protein